MLFWEFLNFLVNSYVTYFTFVEKVGSPHEKGPLPIKFHREVGLHYHAPPI